MTLPDLDDGLRFVEHGFREDRICGVAQHAHASC
jgi:hypothetical protein